MEVGFFGILARPRLILAPILQFTKETAVALSGRKKRLTDYASCAG